MPEAANTKGSHFHINIAGVTTSFGYTPAIVKTSPSSRSYDRSVDAVPEDEIVAYVSGANINSRIDLISLDDLGQLNDDFSRPVTANLSIHSQWTDAFKNQLQRQLSRRLHQCGGYRRVVLCRAQYHGLQLDKHRFLTM